MPIVRRSRKYRAIIGRRCEAYAPLTSGYNGLVGGSNPLGRRFVSLRRYRYSRQVGSAHFSLAPKSRFPETETTRSRDSVRMPVTPKEVRADWRNASPFLAILVK